MPGDHISRVLVQAIGDARPTGPLSPVRLPTATEEVADRLITAIAVGAYLPGERLPTERELAELLEVGRSTVREALGRLLAIGLVEIRRGRSGGTFVRDSWSAASAPSVRRTLLPRQDELEQLFDLYCLVEGMAAHAAAGRRSDEDIDAIRRSLAGYAAARTAAEEQRADDTFHAAVHRAAHNPQITQLCDELNTRTSLGFPMPLWGDTAGEDPADPAVLADPADPESPVDPARADPVAEADRILRQHTALADAVVAGDAELARRIAQEHFTISREIIRRTLTRSLNESG